MPLHHRTLQRFIRVHTHVRTQISASARQTNHEASVHVQVDSSRNRNVTFSNNSKWKIISARIAREKI